MLQRTIREVIAARSAVFVTPGQSVRDAALLMGRAHVGALPVLDSGRLVGIFTERDALLRVIGRSLDPDATTIAEVMTERPQVIEPDHPLSHALLKMHEGGFRHLPVLEGDRLIGVVSARDAIGPEMTDVTRQIEQFERIAEQLV